MLLLEIFLQCHIFKGPVSSLCVVIMSSFMVMIHGFTVYTNCTCWYLLLSLVLTNSYTRNIHMQNVHFEHSVINRMFCVHLLLEHEFRFHYRF